MDFDDIDERRLATLGGKKWNTYDPDVLPAWVADMDFPPAEPIRRALADHAARGDVGYPADPGRTGLPELWAERSRRRFGWGPDPARAEVLVDVIWALYAAAQTYAEPGEGMVALTPIYPPFLAAVADTGRRLVESPLVRGQGGYELDLDHLDEVLDAGTRVLMLCNPHNPTGRVFDRRELEALAERVLRHDLTVIADEIHCDLVYPGRRHIPFASLAPEIEARTVTLASATKSFNTAGLRCAVALFGSEELRERFNRIPRRMRGGLCAFGMLATRVAWEEGDEWLAALLEYLDGNRRRIAAFVDDRLPGVVHAMPEATYLAWLDCRPLRLNEAPHEHFLRRARVAFSPGPSFGTPGEGFVRLNFATSRQILDRVLERTAASLEA